MSKIKATERKNKREKEIGAKYKSPNYRHLG